MSLEALHARVSELAAEAAVGQTALMAMATSGGVTTRTTGGLTGSRRKQRGALRTHDSAGEARSARACAAQPPPPYSQAG